MSDIKTIESEALAAVAGLADRWKTEIADNIERGDLAQASAKLAEAEVILEADPELAELERRLSNRRLASKLLAEGRAQLQSGGGSNPEVARTAIQNFQEVLRLHPDNTDAQNQLDLLANKFTQLAQQAMREGDVTSAMGYVDTASAANNQLPLLGSVRENIREASNVEAEIGELLQEARAYRVADKLINPPGANAAESYHRVLATAEDNRYAIQGLAEVESEVIARASALLAEGKLTDARDIVDRAAVVGLDGDSVQALRETVDKQLSTADAVNSLLIEARDLMEQGFLTEPENNNAVALLRNVMRLQPGNPDAKVLLDSAAQRLATVAQEAYDAGLIEDATNYMDLALTIAPAAADWRVLRNEWSTP